MNYKQFTEALAASQFCPLLEAEEGTVWCGDHWRFTGRELYEHHSAYQKDTYSIVLCRYDKHDDDLYTQLVTIEEGLCKVAKE